MNGFAPRPGVASPCIRSCCLDDDDVCLGCGRSLDEIVGWNEASDDEKAAIVARGRERIARRERGRPGR